MGELDLVDVTVTDPLASGCDRAVGDLAVDASTTYTCTAPGVLVDFTNVATVTGKDRFGEEVTDDDDAVVDVLPVIEVAKLATPDIVNTDGGLVSFAVTVHNRVDEPLILDTLVDDVFGDLRGQGTCALPQTIPVGGSYTCNFASHRRAAIDTVTCCFSGRRHVNPDTTGCRRVGERIIGHHREPGRHRDLSTIGVCRAVRVAAIGRSH
ncbi:MAG: hypothetical protein H6644_20300 [Caldilineaceae bacterium]|nr:hypothetical protein [Caldilineaceae bacterium]